ncbi:CotH kinase family protein [Sulfidibacter corallicola]|uniref:CotH kinase family protein n=1 Tax=Sulfidibacter corallicola TaxID=2818388 RepID=A0A8A4TSG9_SULCO|nr:CotH kinase family protein [Sulfidibacter corallicola]QTD51971.1 CotH kinase family protein [Sulfidibacter corallicola]
MKLFDRLARKESPWMGLLLLTLGLVTGCLLGPKLTELRDRLGTTAPREAEDRPIELDAQFRNPKSLAENGDGAPSAPPAPAENKLPTLAVEIPVEGAQRLQDVRNQALQRGLIVQGEEDTVGVSLTVEDRPFEADLRIKGDWTDHVNSDKWSFRIGLRDGKWRGMRVFSVQHPLTRGYLWEWVVHEAARREGILAPRSMFVNLVVNGNEMGIYFLEEHFSKELLESQGRREGPIVLFNEASFWATYLRFHIGALGFHPKVPLAIQPALSPESAEIRAYGAKRFSSSEALNRNYIGSLEKLGQLQQLLVGAETNRDRLQRLQALQTLKGATVEDLIDVETWSRAHALASLFQIWHGLVWHNLRMYGNPVKDRLEPVLYDNMAHVLRPSDKNPIPLRTDNPIVYELNRSPRYYSGVFSHLGRMCEPGYLEGLFEDLAPQWQIYEDALVAEFQLGPEYRMDAMKQRLRVQQAYLVDVIRPGDAANFSASALYRDGADTPLEATLQVDAWTTTQIPVVIEGFEFPNGVFVSARNCLVSDEANGATILESGGVLLAPRRRARFTWGADQRLTNLENVRQVKSAIRAHAQMGQKHGPQRVFVRFRSCAVETATNQLLDFRPARASWLEEQGRPRLPILSEALERHPFLNYDPVADRLWILPGTWDVDGDLLIPEGFPLHAGPGVTLRFDPGAILFSRTALKFHGQSGKPVVLEPKAGHDRWRGLLVLETKGRSQWRHVIVRNTDSLARRGWVTTGGITFYHAAVTMQDCHIDGTLAEDGTNLFGTEFLLERVTFSGCASDSLDGDFVVGDIRDCVFRDGLADGVDFSGSQVTVTGCRFLDLGDKALSIGERTRCVVRDCVAERVSIGLASKDDSDTTVEGFEVRSARNFAFALYIKKPEYGVSRVEAKDIKIGAVGRKPFLVQDGCRLTVNGRPMDTEAVDVGRMYRDKILGN